MQSSSNQESSLTGEAVNAVKQGVDEAVTSSENIASRGAHTARDVIHHYQCFEFLIVSF